MKPKTNLAAYRFHFVTYYTKSAAGFHLFRKICLMLLVHFTCRFLHVKLSRRLSAIASVESGACNSVRTIRRESATFP
jgi:hypothetical protein